MTTTQQLYQWCTKHRVSHFKGVFCSSQLPDLKSFYEARIILNWSPCSGGTHWLQFTKIGNKGYWFDSYGLEPGSPVERAILGGDPKFKEWIKKQVDDWEYNHIDMQGIRSDVCGQYACWSALKGSPQQNPAAWEWPSDNREQNDMVIQRLVRIPGFKPAH